MRTRTRMGLVGGVLAMGGLLALPQAAQAAPRCFGKKATIVGTGQNDILKGTPRRDVIVGLGGHDRINGRGGDDLICGGGGRDVIRGKGGDDQISGGGKSDFLIGHAGNDRLLGGGGGDVLVGYDGDDALLGGPGNEIGPLGTPGLFGGPGNDLIDGGPGAFDLASFENAPVGVIVDLNVTTPQNTNEGLDTIVGVEGLVGTQFNDVLIGQNVPSETGNGLFGLGGTDQLMGMDGNDVLDGMDGNDKGGPGIGLVHGGLGNDIVLGGSGDDDLYGDAGNDILDGFEDGETTGDFGSGGPDTDECYGIEIFDEPPPTGTCETVGRRGATARLAQLPSARWLRVSLS